MAANANGVPAATPSAGTETCEAVVKLSKEQKETLVKKYVAAIAGKEIGLRDDQLNKIARLIVGEFEEYLASMLNQNIDRLAVPCL